MLSTSRIILRKGQTQGNRLIVSVDLDMWWHCRWATGSAKSIWSDTGELFREYYHSDKPGAELVAYVEKTLALLERNGIKATFFILGEMAALFPEQIKKIAGHGHEIACHGWYHVDAGIIGEQEFLKRVSDARKLLCDLSGQPVYGYRAPNLMTAPWMLQALRSIGFRYDSSISPSRKLMGKYSGNLYAPNNPFLLGFTDGNGEKSVMPELPIPVLPLVKLPGGSPIFTRFFGRWWAELCLRSALKSGDAVYYFHPYEIGDKPVINDATFYIRLFLRNIGTPYENMLDKMFIKYRGQTSCAWDVAEKMLEEVNS